MTEHLPVIQPDESGDVPRCIAECPSASHAPCCAKCIDCEAGREQTEVGLVCQPRLLRAYAELREIKARRCDGCENWSIEILYNATTGQGYCSWFDAVTHEDDYCRKNWDPRR